MSNITEATEKEFDEKLEPILQQVWLHKHGEDCEWLCQAAQMALSEIKSFINEKFIEKSELGLGKRVDEYTKEDLAIYVRGWNARDYSFREEVVKMIEEQKDKITSNNPENQWIIGRNVVLDELLSTLKKRI